MRRKNKDIYVTIIAVAIIILLLTGTAIISIWKKPPTKEDNLGNESEVGASDIIENAKKKIELEIEYVQEEKEGQAVWEDLVEARNYSC